MASSYRNLSSALLFSLSFVLAFIPNAYSQPGPAAAGAVIDVKASGAKGDGIADDTTALLDAWTKACAATTKTKMLVPAGTYSVKNITFAGQCKNPVEFQLDGTIKAPVDSFGSDDWVMFKYVNGLTVSGKGAFDGNGAKTWGENKCSEKESGGKCHFPVNLRFNFINDGLVTGITSLDSKNFHIGVMGCKNIKLQGIKIQAPGTSVNTDGIHLGDSSGVEISGSTIGTGDDCISMNTGIENLNIFGVTCGPGHGISIGSLGKCDKPPETINGVSVKNCTFTGTDNGVRIKTWPSGTEGTVTNVTFEDIIMNNVKNPIVIDQEYCPYNKCDKSSPSKVKISKVAFRKIRGTSATKEAMTLICGMPCEGVELSEIDLKYTGPDGPGIATCKNLKPAVALNTVPAACPA